MEEPWAFGHPKDIQPTLRLSYQLFIIEALAMETQKGLFYATTNDNLRSEKAVAKAFVKTIDCLTNIHRLKYDLLLVTSILSKNSQLASVHYKFKTPLLPMIPLENPKSPQHWSKKANQNTANT